MEFERIKKTKVTHGIGTCNTGDEPITITLGYQPSFILLTSYRSNDPNDIAMNVYDPSVSEYIIYTRKQNTGLIGTAQYPFTQNPGQYITLNEDGFTIEPGIGKYEYYTEK